MWRRMFAAALVVAAVVALPGCAKVTTADPGPGFDGARDVARQRAQADEELARWANLLRASPQGFFLTQPPSLEQVGQFEPDIAGNVKDAVYGGQVVATGPMPGDAPAGAALRFPDGSTAPVRAMSAAQTFALAAGHPSDCHGCQPVEITGAELGTTTIGTSKGEATVPAWHFRVRGSAGRLVRAAIAAEDFPTMPAPPWDSANPPAGQSINAASVSADGRTLTVLLTGSKGPASEVCGADYTAVPVESVTAVVVMIIMRLHDGPELCDLMGHPRSATAQLAAPLGSRAVLEVRTGQLVPVTRS